jgi:ubiquinone/menaquinone biosynthesis C-methylase UbiE
MQISRVFRELGSRLRSGAGLSVSRRWGDLKASEDNSIRRDTWVAQRLAELPAGWQLIDVGAGQCQYKKHCGHLVYKSQDNAIYDGRGDSVGLQTDVWDFSKIDIVCDLLDIPENDPYDAALFTEVLEHIPDPAAALYKMARLVKPSGLLILTAPFCSFTHFAPYFYGTGFSRYFYKHHLPKAGFEIVEITENGGFFDFLEQEIARSPTMIRQYLGREPSIEEERVLVAAAEVMAAARHNEAERRASGGIDSSAFVTFGLHVVARRV